MQTIIPIYFILLGSSIYFSNWILFITLLFIGILLLISYPAYKKSKKQTLKSLIKNEKQAININKATWWEFEELPCITKVQAKKAVYIRRHNGNYVSKEDFYEKNTINDKDIELISKVIYL